MSDSGQFAASKAQNLADLVQVADGAVVSRTLVKNGAGTITLFAFADGQELSEHTAPFDALVQVVEGTATLTIGGEAVQATAGDVVLMPANIPHALQATSNMKMLLTMLKA